MNLKLRPEICMFSLHNFIPSFGPPKLCQSYLIVQHISHVLQERSIAIVEQIYACWPSGIITASMNSDTAVLNYAIREPKCQLAYTYQVSIFKVRNYHLQPLYSSKTAGSKLAFSSLSQVFHWVGILNVRGKNSCWSSLSFFVDETFVDQFQSSTFTFQKLYSFSVAFPASLVAVLPEVHLHLHDCNLLLLCQLASLDSPEDSVSTFSPDFLGVID